MVLRLPDGADSAAALSGPGSQPSHRVKHPGAPLHPATMHGDTPVPQEEPAQNCAPPTNENADLGDQAADRVTAKGLWDPVPGAGQVDTGEHSGKPGLGRGPGVGSALLNKVKRSLRHSASDGNLPRTALRSKVRQFCCIPCQQHHGPVHLSGR